MKLLSIGDSIPNGVYYLHSRFERVCNFAAGERLISLVTPAVGAGPINLVIEAGNLQAVRSVEISASRIRIDNRYFRVHPGQIYHSRLSAGVVDRACLEGNLRRFEEVLLALSSPQSLAFLLDRRREVHFQRPFEQAFMQRMILGSTSLISGEVLKGVRMMRGCGYGLTPSGDDYLAGTCLALHLAQSVFKRDLRSLIDQIHAAAVGRNPFSNLSLQLAKEGRIFEKMKRLITALLHSEGQAVADTTRQLLSIGASSGTDLACGFLLTLKAIFLNKAFRGTPGICEMLSETAPYS